MASSLSSFSPSSPTKKKTTKVSQIQQTVFKKLNSSSSNAIKFTKRQETVFKKAYELSTLCGIEICVICYGLDGELKTWPKDKEKVKDIARRYSELSETKRRKGRVDFYDFLKKINQDGSKKKMKVQLGSNSKYPDWDSRFNDYSSEQLMEVIQCLERNLARIQHVIQGIVEAQKQKMIHHTTMADQEKRMTIAMMNQIQQHSNQGLMHLFNHGNSTSSQILACASSFNQSQSLAPLPFSLQIYYPHSNLKNHSDFFGENGIHEFQSTFYIILFDSSYPEIFLLHNRV